MDWAKAKTQLIYVFIILNIVLGYLLYNRNHSHYDDFDVASILKDNNITLDAEVPKPTSVEGRNLKYKVYTDDVIKRLFFKNPKVSGTDELRTFIEGDKRVDLIQGKTIKYANVPKPDGKLVRSVEDAKIKGKEFLTSIFGEENLRLTNADFKYDRYNLEYEQVDIRNNLILEIAYINLALNENGVITMDRRDFEEATPVKTKVGIQYPKRKLLKLIDMSGVEGRTITDIEYCYSFDPTSIPYINNPEKVLSGVAKLALRVVLDNGRVIIIE